MDAPNATPDQPPATSAESPAVTPQVDDGALPPPATNTADAADAAATDASHAPSSEASAAPATEATTTPAPTPGPAAGLLLFLSEDQRSLQATFTPAADPATPVPLPVAALIHEQIKAQGLDALWLDEPAIQKLVQQAPTAKQPLTMAIGERRDGRCLVKISRDKLSATLTLNPPQGGVALTLEQVQATLAEKGVTQGVLTEVLEAAVAQGHANELEIAQGKKAVNGTNTQFEQLVPDMVERHPHVDDSGLIDYRDLGDLVVVKAGTPLMRRIPPTPGEPGFDVTGSVLSPKPGTSWPFAPGLKGVEFDPNDPELLVSSVTGQPVVVSRGVKVDPNIVLPQVDISTGNVKFEGVIQVKGDVTDGMKVTSTGDVLIGGAVLAGEIEALGNVIIKGGVIGHSEYNSKESGLSSWFSAKVVAQGHIQARYAENAYLRSEANVELDDYAMHSEVTALGHVIIGKPGGKKGKFIGGHARATVSIRVAEAGSDAGPHTVLQAGYNPALTKEVFLLDQRKAKHEAEVANLQKIIDFVTAHPERNKDDLSGRASITQEMHQSELLELEAQRANLLEAMKLADGAHIAIEHIIHGGTEVRLGGKVWQTAEQHGKAVFRIDDEGELVQGS
jgi:hypothetical protein